MKATILNKQADVKMSILKESSEYKKADKMARNKNFRGLLDKTKKLGAKVDHLTFDVLTMFISDLEKEELQQEAEFYDFLYSVENDTIKEMECDIIEIIEKWINDKKIEELTILFKICDKVYSYLSPTFAHKFLLLNLISDRIFFNGKKQKSIIKKIQKEQFTFLLELNIFDEAAKSLYYQYSNNDNFEICDIICDCYSIVLENYGFDDYICRTDVHKRF